MNKLMATIAAGGLMAFSLAGCGSDEPDSPGVAAPTSSSSATSKTSSSPKSTEEETESTASTESAETSTSTETSEITRVNEADYTPADGPNTRLFQLEDGTTRCFLNDLNGEAYLACQVNLANPPMVDDGLGNKVPANAVSWNPGGVTYEVLTFPPTGEMKTLPARSQLSSFGYTCSAYGPSTMECSGPAGSATIDNGNVTGAQMPMANVPPAADGQPDGRDNGAPDTPPEPGMPGDPQAPGNLPRLGGLLPGLN